MDRAVIVVEKSVKRQDNLKAVPYFPFVFPSQKAYYITLKTNSAPILNVMTVNRLETEP